MHHIQSDILTFHLSPILPELRWRVLRYVWLNPRMSQWVQWFFSLPSVAWDDFARARPAHSMRETVRARGKPLTASDSPILWAGCVRAKIVPCYRWGDQCTVCRAWFKGSCLKIPLFCWKFPFFAIMIPFFGCTRLAALVMCSHGCPFPYNTAVQLYDNQFGLFMSGWSKETRPANTPPPHPNLW